MEHEPSWKATTIRVGQMFAPQRPGPVQWFHSEQCMAAHVQECRARMKPAYGMKDTVKHDWLHVNDPERAAQLDAVGNNSKQ